MDCCFRWNIENSLHFQRRRSPLLDPLWCFGLLCPEDGDAKHRRSNALLFGWSPRRSLWSVRAAFHGEFFFWNFCFLNCEYSFYVAYPLWVLELSTHSLDLCFAKFIFSDCCYLFQRILYNDTPHRDFFACVRETSQAFIDRSGWIYRSDMPVHVPFHGVVVLPA